MADSNNRRLAALLIGATLGASAVGCTGTITDGLPGKGKGAAGSPQSGDNPGGSNSGNSSNPGGSAGNNSQNPTPEKPSAPVLPPRMRDPGDPMAAGLMPLRRLTRREYNNTVRDLLGDTTRPADGFPADREPEFEFRRAGLVSSQDFSTMRDAAESLGALAEKNVTTVAPCTAGTAEDMCAKSFITNFGQRAYRRPLSNEEADRLFALYQSGRTSLMLNYAGGINLLVEGILQSPAFLYHWKLGLARPEVEGKVVRLGHYEIASRLSYFLWGSMPDKDLFDAAAQGKLGNADEIESQARRLLDSPKSRETVSAFVEDWLGLDKVIDRPKDAMVYPEFKDDLKNAMVAETQAFVANVVFDGDSKLNTLLTATYSFVNQPLGGVYGMKSVTGMDLKKADLNADERSGLLTQSGFLTVTGSTDGSHPVKRGRKIFERLMCGQLPEPPADVPPPKPASAGGTTRERFAEHSASECARGCHAVMDPLGFAFENYDGIGKFRTMDNGKPVDATGTISLDGADKKFNNARDLSQHLAASESVRDCFATQLFRFAMVRNETDADRASINAAIDAFSKGGNSIKDALVALATTRSFRYRTPGQGENLD